MTFNGVMALILCYFTEFGSFRGTLRKHLTVNMWLTATRYVDGGWWRWALVSPDGVAPSRMVDVSASVNLPLHHKVQRFSSVTSSPGWSRKRGHKTVVWRGVSDSLSNRKKKLW